MTPGYSGKPLYQKLGISESSRALGINLPSNYLDLLSGPEPMYVSLEASPNFVHLFTTSLAELDNWLLTLLPTIDRNGQLWVSWPKKSSKITTDIDENVIRELCLPKGWVDVKVCAVSDVWSGLKLVIRKELR